VDTSWIANTSCYHTQTTGSQEPKALDKRLIQRILVSYGELDLATDIGLIEEMLAAAQTDDGKLNLEAFSKCLTHDVQLYDLLRITTMSFSPRITETTGMMVMRWLERLQKNAKA
jgi:hypothetical protein